MGEDREKVTLDEEEAVRSAVRSEDDVEGHALRDEAVRDAVASGDEEDVEGHALIAENVRDNIRDNIRDSVRDA